MELIAYNYASLYKSLGKTLTTPWNLGSRELCRFRILADWVLDLKGPEKRDLRNDIAHCFNCESHYVDVGGYLESADESDFCAQREFSTRTLWELLERELEPLVGELQWAVKMFEEQIKEMPVQVRKPRAERVMDDMSVPEDPPEWEDRGDWGQAVVEQVYFITLVPQLHPYRDSTLSVVISLAIAADKHTWIP
ncbi:hypothetical protein CC86DRAFT_384134 [Ophiobolus disseminans]|uniref:Uncharacterized protein n=1 Tax=Ophiobolus disseminans TaxID=1469910 RepID=A0A6A6ZTY2_9PLEO|nr:hypothetical protein CC86DRAFT_384134 [Ophiobolus disseminans]